MNTKFLLALLATQMLLIANGVSPLLAGASVVPHDKPYYKYSLKDKDVDVEIIYTKENFPFAKHTTILESPLHESYRDLYDWKLDETLYVGLISDYNQIANGFSTQWPNNRQINYVGGTQMIDYFSTTSWIDTLLYHETAHNYQVNLKGSVVSRSLHTVFGNGVFLIPLPFIIVPNSVENSFMLEGNAVLNESWHGNGGRLYSGSLKAQTLLQAKAGKIKANYMYNSKLEFPYGERYYIQGGFYNYYLAKKYGLREVNRYFKYKSEDWWWPFRTNWSMQESIGMNFEDSLDEFANLYAKKAQKLAMAEGKLIASSQFFSSLGNSEEEIFFITNESGRRAPELIVFDKKSSDVSKQRDSWMWGKVLKVDGEYFTQGSRNTSLIRIYQGLFDSSAFIKEGSESKMIQAYLSDGKAVYFDVASSYDQAQLYIGEQFYAQVNSSVIVDKEDNLYYFKQRGKTRTLYKNRTPLFSYEGFYGTVSDVDSNGRVYFVTNSQLGSTLYSYKDGKVSRASKADNIVEARLVNDKEVLIACVSEKDYYYITTNLESFEGKPFETKLFFEDKPYYEEIQQKAKEQNANVSLDESYYSMLNMHYSGTSLTLGSGNSGLVGALNINFGDPLTQNSANVFVSRNESNISIAGVGYSNSQYLLQYTLIGYGVIDKDAREDVRDSGVVVSATLPFYQAGYYYGALGASYFQDYNTLSREPITVTLRLSTREQFGVSMYSNYSQSLELYGVKEREDSIVGGVYEFSHDLGTEFYLGFGGQYSKGDSTTSFDARGVKLNGYISQVDMDPSTIIMPSLTNSLYAKEVGLAELNLIKVLNLSAYFFTFPLSLQRESLYAKYRYYGINSFSDVNYGVNEAILGITLSTVLLNSFVLPVSFEYIYNDASSIQNEYSFRFLLGASF